MLFVNSSTLICLEFNAADVQKLYGVYYRLWVGKKQDTILVCNIANVNLFYSFTVKFNSEFVFKSYLNMPPHLKCVATLPCELSVFKIPMLKKYLKQTALKDLATEKTVLKYLSVKISII